MATVVSPGRRAAALLAFGALFAVLDVVLALSVHAVLGEAGGWVYRTGTLVHLLGSFLFGAALGLPYARSPEHQGMLAVSSAASGLLLTLHAAAYQIHAAGGHLPTLAGLTIAASAAGGGALLGRSVGIGVASTLALYVLTPRLLPRFEPRTATRGGRIADLATAVLFGFVWVATVYGADGPLYYGATPPVVHLVLGAPQAEVDAPAMTEARHVHQHREHRHDHAHEHDVATAMPEDPPPPDGIPRPTPDIRALLQQLLQSDPPRTVPDPSYPYCRGDELDPAAVARRSVVLVDLSGASMRDAAGSDATSALARLAQEAPTFREIVAPTTTALPGLTAALSGVPALIDVNPLLRLSVPPLPRLPGIATDLRAAGFRTAAFESHFLGSQDRGALLRTLGFERIDGPSLLPGAPPTEAAGRSDAATVDAFFAWAREQRRRSREAPYVALVALRGAPGATGAAAFDAELARLLEWRRANKPEDDTILVVFSDHAPAPPRADARTARFDVPLVLVGLTEEETARVRAVARRAGGLHDIPQTLLALLGSEHRGCHQGVDLLQADEKWPDRRVLLSLFGARQETLVAHDGDHVWIIPREGETANLYNVVEDPARSIDLWAETDSDWGQMKDLRIAYVGMMAYLRRYDRFVPVIEPAAAEGAAARPASGPVRVASLAFGGGAPVAAEERIEAAIRAGFARIRLKVEVGADGAPVVASPSGGEASPLAGVLTRYGRRIGMELVIAPSDRGHDPARVHGELRAIVAAAKAARGVPIRFSTDSAGLAVALAQGTDYPVGLELGSHRRNAAWLDFASSLGVRFVTAAASAEDAAFVQRARNRGLEIQLETSGGPIAGTPPDALTEG